MLNSTLLALPLLLQSPTTSNFDGLKLQVHAAPKEPAVNGPAKSWEGSATSTIFGRTAQTLFYGITITDLKALPQVPTEDRLFLAHEHQARTRKPFAAQNFRKTTAMVGGRKLLVLHGSALAPNASGQPTSSYWVSFAFVAGDKAYEFNQISSFETESKQTLKWISEMKLTEGEREVGVTGVPVDGKGEYTIRGVPFILTTAVTPSPSYTTPKDLAFGDGQYTAVMVGLRLPSIQYKLRQVKADEKRSDAELFRELANSFLKGHEIPTEKFVVKDGTGTVEFEYQEGGKDYVAHARFEHDGMWIAVLVGTAEKAQAATLKETTLRRMPEDE